MSEIIGRCIGEATPTDVMFISKKMPKVGDFVVLEYNGKKVLGMIQVLLRGSVAIPEDIFDPKVVEKIKELEGEDFYIRGKIKILGELENLKIPRTPAPPGTEVKLASSEDLRKVFGQSDSGVKIGSLLTRPEIPIYLDLNKLVSRHLAILAITGYGKSNTVAVLADEILKFKGSILIFDMHSEYTRLALKNGKLNLIPTKINPLKLTIQELGILADIHPAQAFIQFRFLKMAYKKAMEDFNKRKIKAKDFLDRICDYLGEFISSEEYKEKYRDWKKSILAVKNKIEALPENYKGLLDFSAPRILDSIKLNHVNVIDLGDLDEEAADVVVSHTLREILQARKDYKIKGEGLKFPIFLVLEEAHILAPSEINTLSKYWIGRIAREGRKFGIGLCLVSQRPKRLSSDALSQCNNMIILKLVEPSDQRHVQQSSEALSEELLEQLPSLNVGEAVIIGPCIKVPALVKIDKFEGKLEGTDPNVKEEWLKVWEEEEKEREAYLAYTQELIWKEREKRFGK